MAKAKAEEAARFEEVRAALCLCRGGWSRHTRDEVEACWAALTDGQRAAYLEQLRKLPAADRKAFEAELGEVPVAAVAPDRPAGEDTRKAVDDDGGDDDGGGDDGHGLGDDGGDGDGGGGAADPD